MTLFKLPMELMCEIMRHLDLHSLIMLLQAYKELQGLVAILSDFEPADLDFNTDSKAARVKQRSIREVLPELPVYSWTALETHTVKAPVKIIELTLPIQPLKPRYNNGRPGCLPQWRIWDRVDAIAAHLDRYCHVRLVGAPGSDLRHVKLSSACAKAGASFQSSFIPCLDFPTSISTITLSKAWFVSRLKSVHIQGLRTVHIDYLPHARCLFVELEHPRRSTQRAHLSLNSAPMLRRLTLHYKGVNVPVLRIGKHVFSSHYKEKTTFNPRHRLPRRERLARYDCDICQERAASGNMFELARVDRQGQTSSDDGSSHYNGGFEFMERCCCLVLDGVPDWVLYSMTRGPPGNPRYKNIPWIYGLVWKRWNICGPVSLLNEATHLRLLEMARIFHFFTDIEGYTLPHFVINRTTSVLIYTTAHGLNLNQTLKTPSFACLLQTVALICPPYHESVAPLVLNGNYRDWTLFLHNLYTEGHVVLEWLTVEDQMIDWFFGGIIAVRLDMSTHLTWKERAGDGPSHLYSFEGWAGVPCEYLKLVAPNAPELPSPQEHEHYSLEIKNQNLFKKVAVDNRVKFTIDGHLIAPSRY